MHKPFHVLYLTRNGLLEPLGQSQIFPYLRGLSDSYKISLISFEKLVDWSDNHLRSITCDICHSHLIRWTPFFFREKPRFFAPLYAALQLSFTALVLCHTPRQPALIHARSYIPAFIALFLNRLTGIPFIFDMRALWLEELLVAGRLSRKSLFYSILRRLERLCLEEASGVVSLTHAASKYLKETYPLSLATQRLVVIPTCADLQRFQPHPLPRDDALLIGCVGTVLSGWFLLDWLFAFYDSVFRADPSAQFELITRDSPDEIFRRLPLSSSWLDRLTITSATPAEMPQLLRRHTASVMFFTPGLSKIGSSPTRMAEVLGSGRPVVCNRGVGDMDKIITDHRVGVLTQSPRDVDMDSCVNELIKLLADGNLSSRCRRTAEDLFSLESGINAYNQLYTDILS